MIHFFGNVHSKVFAVQTAEELSTDSTQKLIWLFADQPKIEQASIDAFFVGPRAAMIPHGAQMPLKLLKIWV